MKDCKLTERKARKVMSLIVNIIVDNTIQGNDVQITNLGTFKRFKLDAMLVNENHRLLKGFPKNSKQEIIPERYKLKFYPSRENQDEFKKIRVLDSEY